MVSRINTAINYVTNNHENLAQSIQEVVRYTNILAISFFKGLFSFSQITKFKDTMKASLIEKTKVEENVQKFPLDFRISCNDAIRKDSITKCPEFMNKVNELSNHVSSLISSKTDLIQTLHDRQFALAFNAELIGVGSFVCCGIKCIKAFSEKRILNGLGWGIGSALSSGVTFFVSSMDATLQNDRQLDSLKEKNFFFERTVQYISLGSLTFCAVKTIQAYGENNKRKAFLWGAAYIYSVVVAAIASTVPDLD